MMHFVRILILLAVSASLLTCGASFSQGIDASGMDSNEVSFLQTDLVVQKRGKKGSKRGGQKIQIQSNGIVDLEERQALQAGNSAKIPEQSVVTGPREAMEHLPSNSPASIDKSKVSIA
mmetsp:Transcript_92078/g.159803  ORF Transcript_92078/g.159803 Transcript_92078/m.159803 type:complete len:119 (-) Transcript_92078:99-455(-)